MREAIRWQSDGNQECLAKAPLGACQSAASYKSVVLRRPRQWPSGVQSGLISGHQVQSGLISGHQVQSGLISGSTWLAAWNEALKSLRVLANRSDLSFSLNFSCRMRIEPTFLTMPLRAPQ